LNLPRGQALALQREAEVGRILWGNQRFNARQQLVAFCGSFVRGCAFLLASTPNWRNDMGEFQDKVAGHANEIAGKAKRAAGEALDRPDLVAEGDAQEAKGDLQKAKGDVKGAVKGVVDNA
jgi:uncharacterized protein YjbJ (UPF0337 family)